ncbi:MAG: hypothetical protein GXO85_15990 [Chlorobi bacterium]|nr:hypothetical protein [Chlorobiota bacterium]
MKKNTITYIILVLLFTLSYSIVRYNIFKDVPWTDLPLYVVNKAISFAAIIYVAAYLILEKKDYHELSNKMRKYATNLIYIHLTISLILLTPSYYQKFFDGTKMNLTGQISLLSGVLALGLLNSLRFTKKLGAKVSLSFFKKHGAEILLFLIAIHLFAMGFKGWLTPGNWPGEMPPISLLSFITAVIPFFIKKNAVQN